jgi:hypothetical protein
MQITFAVLLVAVTAMGIYLFQLKERTERHAAKASAAAPLTPAGPTTQIALRIAVDSDATIFSRSASASLPVEVTERDRAILRLLLDEYKKPDASHHLGPDSDVNTVFLLNTPNSPDITAVVDLSDSLAKSQPSGILLESLTLDSIAQTLHANDPAIKQVRFLIDGSEHDTLAGHADLRATYPAE